MTRTASVGADGLVDLRSLALEFSAAPERASVVPGLRVYVMQRPTAAIPVVFDPVLYVVLQGTKQLLLDDRIVRYDESQLVIVTVGLPALAQVLKASPEKPYVAVEISLDRTMLAELMGEVGSTVAATTDIVDAISVHETPPELYEPLARLLRMTRDARAARLFASGAVREMAYHVLASPQGSALRQLAGFHSQVARMDQATSLMAQNLERPLHVSQIAGGVGMSVTSLHRHFKSFTGSTPATYYKRLRLHEARRLGVSSTRNVTEAATAVGYVSVPHFSRDYKQMFGEAPLRDFARLRSLG
jgi:AraC-like DNA-binding protein